MQSDGKPGTITPTEALAAAWCNARFQHADMWGHITPAQREPWLREAAKIVAGMAKLGFRVEEVKT